MCARSTLISRRFWGMPIFCSVLGFKCQKTVYFRRNVHKVCVHIKGFGVCLQVLYISHVFLDLKCQQSVWFHCNACKVHVHNQRVSVYDNVSCIYLVCFLGQSVKRQFDFSKMRESHVLISRGSCTYLSSQSKTCLVSAEFYFTVILVSVNSGAWGWTLTKLKVWLLVGRGLYFFPPWSFSTQYFSKLLWLF